MRILIVTNFYHPEKTGIGVTATDCAKFIAEIGHEPTVLTTMPYYPEWEVHAEYQGKLWLNEQIDGISVKRVWQYVPKTPSTLKRILHEITGSLSLFCKGLLQPTDLVLCITPPLTMGFVCAVMALLRRKKHWVYIKDIQPDAAISLGMLKNPLLRSFSVWMEKMLYKLSDRVLVLSNGMKGNLLKKGVPEEKIVIVPDSIDAHELYCEEAKTDSRFRSRYDLKGKFLVLYSGNLGIKHNVELIVDCADALKEEEDIFFAVVGEGAAKESVAQKVKELELKNIALYPLCEREDLGDMLSSADVLLAPQRKEVLDIVVPSKLLAYLSSKTPIVASAHHESEAAKVLKDYSAGVVVEPENPSDVVEEILKLKASPEEALRIGERGFDYLCSNYDHSVVKEKFYRPLFL